MWSPYLQVSTKHVVTIATGTNQTGCGYHSYKYQPELPCSRVATNTNHTGTDVITNQAANQTEGGH